MSPEPRDGLADQYSRYLSERPGQPVERVDEFLNRVALKPDHVGDDDLKELLDVEVARRGAAGRYPTIEELHFRYEGRTRVVNSVLNDLVRPSTVTQVVPGVVLDNRFRILEETLGVGGMGRVHLAFDGQLRCEVALKEASLSEDALKKSRLDGLGARDILARFRHEAEVVGGLQHPGIVAAYYVGHLPDWRPYYVMRRIRGETFGVVIDRFHADQTLRLDQRARILDLRQLLGHFLDACTALHYAHERGVVHCDLKPDNIMVSRRHGETVVVDWGLAVSTGRNLVESLRGTSGSGTPPDSPTERPLSADPVSPGAEEVIKGTPAYMSPEQANGEAVGDARVDVYGLGATLYCLLTGKRPITDRDVGEALNKARQGEIPRPRSVNAEVPRALEAICLKAMALKPGDRYASANELTHDVEQWLADEPVNAFRESWGDQLFRWARKHKAWIRAGAAALVAVTSVAVATAILINQARRAERGQRLVAEGATRLTKIRLAESYLDRGLGLCESGEISRGIHLLARALQATPAESTELARRIRTHLSGWSSNIHTLQWRRKTPNRLVSIAVAPDGRTFLTGNVEGQAQLWDASTGAPVGPPLIHQGEVAAVTYSPDGRTVLTGSHDHTARLWDTKTFKQLGDPIQHPDKVNAVAFSPNGQMILTGGDDRTMRMWNVRTMQLALPPMRHRFGIKAVAFSTDGRSIMTGSYFGHFRLWDATTGQPSGFTPETNEIGLDLNAVAFSPDGQVLLAGDNSGTVRLWNAATGKLIRQPYNVPGVEISLAMGFSPGRYSLVASSYLGDAVFCDTLTGMPLGELVRTEADVRGMAFHPDNRTILTVSIDGMIASWDAMAGQAITRLRHEKAVKAVAFSPDGHTVLTGGEDGKAWLWDVRTGRHIGVPMEHGSEVNVVAFSPDGRTVLTGGQLTGKDDAKVRAWDASNGEPVGETMQNESGVTAIAFSRDGRSIVTAGFHGKIKKWDAITHKLISEKSEISMNVEVAFTPDLRSMLVRTGLFPGVTLFDVETGKGSGNLVGHRGNVTAVAISTDSRFALTGSGDRTARLWDIATFKPIGEPMQHQNAVVDAAFSRDGKIIVTGSADGAVRFWETKTTKPIGSVIRHPAVVSAVAISFDGRTVVAGCTDGTAYVWPVPNPIEGEPNGIEAWMEATTGTTLDSSGGLKVLDQGEWEASRRRAIDKKGPPLPGM